MKLYISVLLLSLSSLIWAEGPLTSQMETFLVTEKGGKETVVATEQASPGDVVEYRLTYRNTGEQPLSGLVITGPVPANTAYVGGSANTKVDASFTVSIDNGTSFLAEPVTREVKDADGQSKDVTVPPSDYTQVRWQPNGSLKPDQEQQYRYRVKVQ